MSWLQKVLDDAAREVASWPEWKRKMMADYLRPAPDPRWSCIYRRWCDEVQTCNGKPCRTVRALARPAPDTTTSELLIARKDVAENSGET